MLKQFLKKINKKIIFFKYDFDRVSKYYFNRV
jgi:hypothetical protein